MTHPAAAGLVSLGDAECDLDLTLGCGQVFHWTREGAGYAGAHRGHTRLCRATEGYS